jgi:GntR family transcriptional repressor for pyruvate dehydrogenase complex
MTPGDSPELGGVSIASIESAAPEPWPNPQREELRTPKVADLLADRIRFRILSGDLTDGERLPPQDELLAEYGVGRSSLREALRILESERLIHVRRGNIGGATILRPSAGMAAYTLGMVLQSRSVPLADVGGALKLLEPLCAELCAQREDRDHTVLPTLTAVHEAAEAAINDPLEVIRQSRHFHEQLAKLCGNETLILVVGALEELWSEHEAAWARMANSSHSFPEMPLRHVGLAEHRALLKCIRKGDAAGAARAARKHLRTSQLYAMSAGADVLVRVTGF